MPTMKLYTVKEAAKIVGVSTNTLYKYLDEDRIHAARGSAIQGRFRIPEVALEEFLGVTLSTPEPVIAPPADPSTPPVPVLAPREGGGRLPLKFARILLILALIAILADLFLSRTVSLPGQIFRLVCVMIMLLLAYAEGGYRRG